MVFVVLEEEVSRPPRADRARRWPHSPRSLPRAPTVSAAAS